jgi:hypothetical protein
MKYQGKRACEINGNRIHGPIASMKQILSLGGPHFVLTVNPFLFGMFFAIRHTVLQHSGLPHFLVMAMNSVRYGEKETAVQIHYLYLLWDAPALVKYEMKNTNDGHPYTFICLLNTQIS